MLFEPAGTRLKVSGAVSGRPLSSAAENQYESRRSDAMRRACLGPAPAIIGNIEMQAINFERITVNPNQMGGIPCIRGLRIPVATVLRMLAGGMTEQEILTDYPDLQSEDIRECLRFAAVAAMERDLPLSRTA
jgi:uncharacterized protein (DUF433 family)